MPHLEKNTCFFLTNDVQVQQVYLLVLHTVLHWRTWYFTRKLILLPKKNNIRTFLMHMNIVYGKMPEGLLTDEDNCLVNLPQFTCYSTMRWMKELNTNKRYPSILYNLSLTSRRFYCRDILKNYRYLGQRMRITKSQTRCFQLLSMWNNNPSAVLLRNVYSSMVFVCLF